MPECFLLRSQAMGIIQIKTIWSMTFIKNICAHNCAMLVYAYMGGGGRVSLSLTLNMLFTF